VLTVFLYAESNTAHTDMARGGQARWGRRPHESGVGLDYLLSRAVYPYQMRAVFHRAHPQVERSKGIGAPEYSAVFRVPVRKSRELASP
jgi:hypothetical protein